MYCIRQFRRKLRIGFNYRCITFLLMDISKILRHFLIIMVTFLTLSSYLLTIVFDIWCKVKSFLTIIIVEYKCRNIFYFCLFLTLRKNQFGKFKNIRFSIGRCYDEYFSKYSYSQRKQDVQGVFQINFTCMI